MWIKDYDGDGIWDLAIRRTGRGWSRRHASGCRELVRDFRARRSTGQPLLPTRQFMARPQDFTHGAWIRSGDITKDEPDDLALWRPAGTAARESCMWCTDVRAMNFQRSLI